MGEWRGRIEGPLTVVRGDVTAGPAGLMNGAVAHVVHNPEGTRTSTIWLPAETNDPAALLALESVGVVLALADV